VGADWVGVAGSSAGPQLIADPLDSFVARRREALAEAGEEGFGLSELESRARVSAA